MLAGDGRCDSPGHNAKYGKYSVMEVTTEKIVHFSLVQVSEVANSNGMEKEGLKRCLEFLEGDGQVIDLLATDRYLNLTDGRYLNEAKDDPTRRSINQKSMPLNSLKISIRLTLSTLNLRKLMKPSIYRTFYGFTAVITHLGCWDITREVYKSRAHGE